MPFGPRDNPYDPTDPNKIYACPGCNKTFTTKPALMRHVREDH